MRADDTAASPPSLKWISRLYNLALPPLLLAALPMALLKQHRRGGSWRHFPQRLGLYDDEVKARLAALDRPIWMHAVSVGEVLVAAKIAQSLRALAPAIGLVVSTTTSTGHALAQQRMPQGTVVIFNPIDLPFAVARALDAVRPSQIVLVEAEVWPNFVQQAKELGLPITLAAARLSPRSERRYLGFKRWVAPLFGQLDQVLVPEPEDTVRWGNLGIDQAKLTATGSVKHDEVALGPDLRLGQFRTILDHVFGPERPPVILAASTHDGEEVALADALDPKAHRHDFALAIAPRHFERAAEIESTLRRRGYSVVRRSQLPQDEIMLGSHEQRPDIFLIDSTGELRAWQSLAAAVIIGKSFHAHGGQNPVEALQVGKPVIMGPNMENFQSIVSQLLAAGGAFQVATVADAAKEAISCLKEPERAEACVSNGKRVLAKHHGSAERTARLILEVNPRR